MLALPPPSTLFPYTTLFRSAALHHPPVLRLQSLGHGPGEQVENRLADDFVVIPDAAHLHVAGRSEEHTSELQSLRHLVCRLLLEKKKNTKIYICGSMNSIE